MTKPKILHLWCELNFEKLSKNSSHAINLSGKKKIVSTNKKFMDNLITEIQVESKIQNIQWEKTKTWLFIHCLKKNERGDPNNVLDVLSDVVKKGIGIDDNVFASLIDYKILIDTLQIDYTPRVDFYIIQAEEEQVGELIIKFLKGEL
jgi:hypothetical protein